MSIRLIQQAICYLEEHIYEDISYAEVAESVHMSSYNFHRAFSFIVGMTANEYLRKRRLTLAARELQTTDISVIDAAYKYGYDSPESFSKAFSRFHGSTPTMMTVTTASLTFGRNAPRKILLSPCGCFAQRANEICTACAALQRTAKPASTTVSVS